MLVVDKPEYMLNIEKIKNESKDEKLKADVSVYLKRDITDQERLMHSFSQEKESED